jgi:lipase ATG15
MDPLSPTGPSLANENPENLRSIRDYDDDDETGPTFVDHFSLRHPSSTVRFRGSRVHVYESSSEQILLEDRRSRKDSKGDRDDNDDDDDDDDNGKSRSRQQHSHTVTVKRMDTTSFGLRMLRLAYTLISLLIFGYVFALCFQIILFLFLNLPVDAGLTSGNADQDSLKVISTLLSVPVFLFGLSSLMAIGSTFVADCWSGGHLVRAVFTFPVIISEIIYFTFFLLIPALTFIIALFAHSEHPWEVCCYVWIATTAFTFCCFGLAIVWTEVSTCFLLLSIHYNDNDEDTNILLQIQRSILLMQTQKYSGKKEEEYLVSGEDIAPDGGYTFSEVHQPMQVKRSLYTRLTQMKCLRFMWEPLDPIKRIYSIEEVRDVLPFLTNHNWSLESMFCSGRRSRRIISARGPSALSTDQVMASFICNIIGTIFIIIFFIGILVWMSTGTKSYILVAFIGFFCCLLPMIRSNNAMLKLYTDINKDDSIRLVEDEDEINVNELVSGGDVTTTGEEGVDVQTPISSREKQAEKMTMFRLWEIVRITKPKVWVCYTGLLLEFFFLFLWPVATLFNVGNNPIAGVFLIISLFSFLRKYFDAAAILCELGSMDDIDIEKEPGKESKGLPFFKKYSSLKGRDKTLVLKSRLADVVGNISRSGSVVRWMYLFGFLVLLTFVMFLGAISQDDGLGERPPIVLVDDYYYPGEKTLQYPTCSMSKGFQFSVDGENFDSALADYAFLSAMSYEVPNVTSYLLPQWFGTRGIAVDEDAFVKQYRKESGTDGNPTYFKLFTFPSMPGTAVVAIRGSQTSWDWLVNMQLWSASGLAQIVKWLTPYGWLWTPVLDDVSLFNFEHLLCAYFVSPWIRIMLSYIFSSLFAQLVWFVSIIQSNSLKKVSYYTVTTDFVNSISDTYDGLRVTG